jgi:hypothetical protein
MRLRDEETGRLYEVLEGGLLEVDEDSSNWHPHHELITAWAKGAQIQTWHPKLGWVDCSMHHIIGGFPEYQYRIKPDNSAEIAVLEKEVAELVDELCRVKRKLNELRG